MEERKPVCLEIPAADGAGIARLPGALTQHTVLGAHGHVSCSRTPCGVAPVSWRLRVFTCRKLSQHRAVRLRSV